MKLSKRKKNMNRLKWHRSICILEKKQYPCMHRKNRNNVCKQYCFLFCGHFLNYLCTKRTKKILSKSQSIHYLLVSLSEMHEIRIFFFILVKS